MPNALIQYRRKNKLSRRQLAEKLGCHVSYVGHIERGIRTISPELAIEWEERAGIPREELRPDLWQ